MNISTPFISGPAGITVESPSILPSDITMPGIEVRHIISRSGKATVMLAHHKDEQRDVALKVTRIPTPSREVITDALEREMRICQLLPASPLVLPTERLHYVSNSEGVLFGVIEMSYADGGSLREQINQRHDDAIARRQQAVPIFRALCTGLGQIHDVGISHLDIKPENILFRHGNLTIADFGAAVLLPMRATPETDKCALSLPSPATGTSEYMSPERWTGRAPGSVDERADIYSSGAVFWELLSLKGAPPFDGSPRRLARMHAEAPVPEIEGVPDGLINIIRKCMAKRAADRYRHMDELLDALDEAEAVSKFVETAAEAKVGTIRQAVTDAFAEKDWSRAARWCERLLAVLPCDELAEEVMAYVGKQRAEADALYQAIANEQDRANLTEAVCIMTHAMDCFPGHPLESVTAIRLARQATAFRESLDACVDAALAGDFAIARRLAARALDLNRDATAVARLLGRLDQQLAEIALWQQRLSDAIGRNDLQGMQATLARLNHLEAPARGGGFANVD